MIDVFRDKRTTYILLLCILIVAAWLRFYQLGLPALDRNQDEDIMAAAVMGIQEHGSPLMPGGMTYLRSAPMLYLMAASADLFGLDELGLRLPAALFGLLLVPLGYFVARRYFGEACGIAAAVLIACSFWEVDVSRNARMYTIFAFFYTVTAYGIARGYLEDVRAWRWAVLPLTIFAISLHGLGFTLGAAIGLMAVVPRQKLITRVGAFGSAVAAAAWFFYRSSIEGAAFYRPAALAASQAALGAGAGAGGGGRSLPARIAGRLYFPDDLLFTSPALPARAFLVAGLLAGAALIFLLLRRSPAVRRPWPLLLLAACLLAGAMQQFQLATGLLAVFVIVQGRGVWAVAQPRTYAVVALLALLFAGWFALGVSGAAGLDLSAYETLRALLDYPKVAVVRRFVLEQPFLTVLAGLGMILAVHRASIQKSLTPQAFFAVLIAIALTLHGVFESQFRPRYNFNIEMFYLIFAAFGAVEVTRYALERIRKGRALPVPQTAALIVPSVLAVGWAWPDLRPTTSFLLVHNWEGSPPAWVERHALPWHPDRKSPAVYVRTHAAPGDEILTMDWMTSYFYARRVDYWLRSSDYEATSYREGDHWREMYLGAQVVPDAQALGELLADPCRGTLWVITSAWVLRRQPHHLTPEIYDVLDGLEQYRVHQGLDGLSAAYRIPARGGCQQGARRTGG